MNIPTDIDQIALHSMQLLGIEPGENWETARHKMVQAFMKDRMDVLHHVFQALIGERIDAGDARNQIWGSKLALPIATGAEGIIQSELEDIAKEVLQ